MSEFIRPDIFTALSIGEETYMVNAKYDRLDHFPEIGAWILKIYDDERGLLSAWVEEAEAQKIIKGTDLSVVTREFMYESEHRGWIEGQVANLSDSEFDFSGIDEQAIIDEYKED